MRLNTLHRHLVLGLDRRDDPRGRRRPHHRWPPDLRECGVEGRPVRQHLGLSSANGGVSWTNKPIIVSPFSCTYAGAHDPDTGARSEAAASRTLWSTPTTGARSMRSGRTPCRQRGGSADLVLAVERQRSDVVSRRGDQQDPGRHRRLHPDRRGQRQWRGRCELLRLPEQHAGRRGRHGRLAPRPAARHARLRRTGRRRTSRVRSTCTWLRSPGANSSATTWA